MGGHEHHHGPPKDPYRVPSAEEYAKIESPELIKLQERLAKHGLKDPWMRNYNWTYDKRYGSGWGRMGKMMFRGVPLGVGLFIATLGIEKALGIDWHAHHHAHEEGHSEAHH
ncbi:NADH dehydrogenase [ubiquinone] 1 beta subcomplex subunit 3 [Microplitis demolitor]|uniref:NADH dehydrogenase [ubiquinone] 1 beta subcomplex subunit 3 n=1 Tax=Microplitis demolitor TaxID=69319 RepID=UPI0004CDD551|nr:NADH dehydrogenase [ubiquinone] 1 beta subcomplex subunit 3 [Microplitis demolitor]XP_008561162.1 NADH dehydrogenase [ubiquinone] 1 beta subcomplex subunit 3 [Microplitis demolitor]XP_008561163.1 NADH dehydrogenase [ubiquinone] 1 beta subcomplex subunit 3 [Microplitis demolitor]